MFLPEAGEFRLILQTCKDLSINDAVFSHYSNHTDISFDKNFV